jgi:hypothetical protein
MFIFVKAQIRLGLLVFYSLLSFQNKLYLRKTCLQIFIAYHGGEN